MPALAARCSGSRSRRCCHAHVLCRMGRIREAEAEARSAFEASPQAAPGLLPMVVAYMLEPMAERAEPHGLRGDPRGERAGRRDLGDRHPGEPAALQPRASCASRPATPGARWRTSRRYAAATRSWASTTRACGRRGRRPRSPTSQLGERSTALARPRTSWRPHGAGARRARSRSPCAPPASPRAVRTGIELLRESVAVVEDSPARYEHGPLADRARRGATPGR